MANTLPHLLAATLLSAGLLSAGLLSAGLLSAGLLAATSTAVHAAVPAGYVETAVASSLSQPTAIAFLPDARMVVTEKQGALQLVDGSTTTTLATLPVCSGSEMGLLGVAVDPDFAANGFLYLYRTTASGSCSTSTGRVNQVVRVTMSGDAVSLASLTVLLTGIRTDVGNHDGGALRIGPDRLLYVGAGDSGLGDNAGGPGTSSNPYAQDLNSLNGKILRIGLDGSIPADNPFAGQAGKRGEIYAYGFRNPFRIVFDPLSDRLWVNDVGDLTWEEIDIVGPGDDASWPSCEANAPAGCAQPGDLAPVFAYPHVGAASLGSSITGGAFAGTAFGAHAGDYFFADYVSGTIFRVALDAARTSFAGAPQSIVTIAGGPVDLVTGPDGALFYVSVNVGQVRRVAAVAIPTDLDDYLCYKAGLVPGQSRLPSGMTLGLADDFRTATFGVQRAVSVCNPVVRDGDPALAPNTYHEGFGIKAVAGTPRFQASSHAVIDDFGALELTALSTDGILVPSSHAIGSGGAPAPPADGVDHFECYKAKVATGSSPFAAPADPLVQDSFFTTRLCNPVAVDGGAIANPGTHLVCYQVRLAPGSPRPAKQTVSVANATFGEDVLTLASLQELCVAALVDP